MCNSATATSSKSEVLLIIPAFNEEDSIVDTVERVVSFGYDYVVINDGSKDRTLEICESKGFNVVDLPRNLGIGGAVQTGYKYAKRHGYSIAVQFDGDGQHDIAYVDRIVNAVRGGVDLAIGSRFIGNESQFQSTNMRRLGIKWLSFWMRLFTGSRHSDPTSGFRAAGTRAIDLFCGFYPTDYPEPESIVKACKLGLRVVDVPVSMNERIGGSSSINAFASVYYMIKVTLAIFIIGLQGGR